MPRDPVTIKHVARLAGVSVSTVSNVLSGKARKFSPDTAAKVNSAVQTLDFYPNRAARSLSSRRTQTLGLVMDGMGFSSIISKNYFFNEVLDGFLKASLLQNYQTKIIACTQENREEFKMKVDDGSVDGAALIAPARNGMMFQWAQQTSLPVVVVGAIPEASSLSYVSTDDQRGLYEITQHLIRKGHQKIGMIGGPGSLSSAELRREGYLKALQDHEILFRKGWYFEGSFDSASGFEGTRELLNRYPGFTAIVCANDWMALGALEFLHSSGIKVPQDISVAGFDDFDAARYSNPPLTTAHQPMVEIGRKAAEILVRSLELNPPSPEKILLPATFVERSSVDIPKS